jgi:hypothetical protein
LNDNNWPDALGDAIEEFLEMPDDEAQFFIHLLAACKRIDFLVNALEITWEYER